MKLNKMIVLMSLALIPIYSWGSTADWSGFYLGVNAGESINSSNDQTILSVSPNSPIAGNDYVAAFNVAGNQALNFNNFIAGVQAGYRFQVNNWVIGLETNYDPTEQVTASQMNIVPNCDYDGNCSSSITQSIYQSWDFTMRPQVGYAINHFLMYVTGGFSLTKINYNSYTNWDPVDNTITNDNTTINEVLSGWAAGAGIDWKFRAHYSLSAEYLYQGFGNFNEQTGIRNNSDPNALLNHKGEFSSNVLMLGINYLF